MKGFGIYVKNNLLEPKHFEAMGESIWLYLWLLDKMTSVNENGVGKVLGNKPITHEMVYADLPVSARSYRRWIDTLRSAGYIQTLRTPHGLCILVTKAQKKFKSDVPKMADHLHSDVPNSPSDVPKMVPRSAKLAHVRQDNTRTIQDKTITTRNKVPDEQKEIGVLYYQVIKKLKLPVRNHNSVKSKIKQMSTEDEYGKIIGYLTFMRDHFTSVEWPYKPHINEALDIYNKRLQIKQSIEKHAKGESGMAYIS